MMDMDRAWDAWLSSPHEDHGGFLTVPDKGAIRCACGTLIQVPQDATADTALPGPDEIGYEWRREELLEFGGAP